MNAGISYLRRVLSFAWLYLKRPFLLPRVRRPVLERIDGVPLVSLPDVLNPVVFRSGELLARTVAASSLAEPPGRALDMGTGSGVGAVFLARRGWQVVAVDLNPEAVRCARINVLLNRLEDRVEVRQGDLFGPVAGERFDLILFNPPFFRGEPKGLFDLAWRSTDVMERFAAGLPDALTEDGRVLLLLSTDGDSEGMLKALATHGLKVEPAVRRDYGNEVMTIYCVRR
ncbi:MAG TPA: methyltransferase [Thermoanaerobaculia bacterium]|nr:methyltransferase [Thermoanaerobaculia bacterium]